MPIDREEPFSRHLASLITLALLIYSVGFASSQAVAETLSISSPLSGATLTAGSTITITVSVAAGANLQGVAVVGEGIGFSNSLAQPPYTFSMEIPENIGGSKSLTAMGRDAAGAIIYSAPVKVTILPAKSVSSIAPSIVDFTYVGQQVKPALFATFADGTLTSVRNLPGTTFTSQNISIVTVTPNGIATATGPGNNAIHVNYNGISVDIPVSVPRSIPGDLNRDSIVDQLDLGILQSTLNTAATGPNDARDLNRDGKIDALDLRILTTLCTYPRCASTKP